MEGQEGENVRHDRRAPRPMRRRRPTRTRPWGPTRRPTAPDVEPLLCVRPEEPAPQGVRVQIEHRARLLAVQRGGAV